MYIYFSRVVLFALTISVLGCSDAYSQEATNNWEFVDALPQRQFECAEPTIDEQELYNTSVELLEKSGSMGETHPRAHSLVWGINKFLAYDLQRHSQNEATRICPSKNLYQRVDRIVTEYKLLSFGRLTETGLNLAAKIENPSKYVVDVVAASAFAKTPQQSESFVGKDIRPYARTVLAGFREHTKDHIGDAFSQVSSANSLGTGAAQIAVSGGHPEILPLVESLMIELLDSVPNDQSIPYEKKLAYTS